MKTVLIVEDDRINVLVYSNLLTRRGGLVVKHSENVDEIMQIAKNGEADVILMSLRLANSFYQGELADGIRITQLLKANSQTSAIPVILAIPVRVMVGETDYFLKQSGTDMYVYVPLGWDEPNDYELFVDYVDAILNGSRLGWSQFQAQY